MVYANFSSNLPTGLQHFEFVDLTISLYDETLCISLGTHKPNRDSCPLCYMNVTMAIVVLLHVHVCWICHVMIYNCTLHWYHIAIDLIWFGGMCYVSVLGPISPIGILAPFVIWMLLWLLSFSYMYMYVESAMLWSIIVHCIDTI